MENLSPEGWQLWEGGNREINKWKSIQNFNTSNPGLPAPSFPWIIDYIHQRITKISCRNFHVSIYWGVGDASGAFAFKPPSHLCIACRQTGGHGELRLLPWACQYLHHLLVHQKLGRKEQESVNIIQQIFLWKGSQTETVVEKMKIVLQKSKVHWHLGYLKNKPCHVCMEMCIWDVLHGPVHIACGAKTNELILKFT